MSDPAKKDTRGSGSELALGPAVLKPGAALRILPSGVFSAKDGRPANMPSSQVSAWKMDAGIASRLMAMKPRSGPAYVIDYEHQTLNKEKNGQPAPAAGWFGGLEWREGEGLFANGLEWTERARAMIAANEYRFISPVFTFDPLTGAVTSIHSVAITNDPALLGLADMAAATASFELPTQPLSPGITEDDARKLQHAFGHLPGFSVQAALVSASASTGSMVSGEKPCLTEKQRQIFRDSFGITVQD